MIPKVIHYCWFGGSPKPPLILRCMESWRKILPEYDIIEWNESNYDFSAHPYPRNAYAAKKWAFVTDYARLDILYRYGGIYFDTDVEVLKPFDRFLTDHAFCGMETTGKVATGLVTGCEAGHAMIRLLRDAYNGRSFLHEDGSLDMTPCPLIQTESLKKTGFVEEQQIQQIQHLTIYPSNFFCPRDSANRPVHTSEAYSIHHYAALWQPWYLKLKKRGLNLLSRDMVVTLIVLKHIVFRKKHEKTI